MISTRASFGDDYMKRCLEVDGYIVMKSSRPFRIGDAFGGAVSSLLEINQQMIVVGLSNASEAVEQAKKIANFSLGLKDRTERFYYRVGPNRKRVTDQQTSKAGWVELIKDGRATT